MRLTKTDKDAFVRAVLDDVPSIDYDTQAHKLVRKGLIAKMPQVVREAYEAHPDWVRTNHIGLPAGLNDFYGPARGYTSAKDLSPEIDDELETLRLAKKEQSTARDTLESHVRGMIESVTTLKAALKNFPEFAKYLPADRDATGTANLPAANVIAALTNAGWPKK